MLAINLYWRSNPPAIEGLLTREVDLGRPDPGHLRQARLGTHKRWTGGRLFRKDLQCDGDDNFWVGSPSITWVESKQPADEGGWDLQAVRLSGAPSLCPP